MPSQKAAFAEELEGHVKSNLVGGRMGGGQQRRALGRWGVGGGAVSNLIYGERLSIT